ncbi:hypothetical protein PLICRDRAFT_46398 [Plicaturopsis crispa FD-325 SS-3]|uniref:Survival protein SurE-like phosphatase/nucleotidase domain-containing protein n=1 Tax=Plicaturopsis crispa FD-325 SS-3 TaxID=944288 RepID=A0A0C9T413_PLICR|nr:hypothetical protein PLICRDRAFT_46398 [Plicaturopsis crispa FD-325 SS-3]
MFVAHWSEIVLAFAAVAAASPNRPGPPASPGWPGSPGHGNGVKVLLTNDDGWAELNIRAQNDALIAAGYNVVLSAPAENKSGTGSSTATPTVLNQTCEFNTCPVGSPPTGFNASNPRLNYVNAYPVDSARFGIQKLAPKFFWSKPDLVFSGFNVGSNLGPVIQISGTVGAACEAAKEGVPSIAFSAASGDQLSYTTLANKTAPSTLAARLYSALGIKFVDALLSSHSHGPILPPNVTVNVNYPATNASVCSQEKDFKYIFTRVLPDAGAVDVKTCGGTTLPDETTVVETLGAGCYVSVSVFNATTKADVNAETQEFVLRKLGKLLTCLPK